MSHVLRQWLLVWVRQGCHHRARPVNGLNHRNVLSPGSRGQTSEIKVSAASLPSEDPGKEPAPGRFPSLFPGLLAASLWSSSGVPPACACVQIVPFSKNASSTGVRAPPTLIWLHLNWLHVQPLCFQIHHLLGYWGVRTWTYEFWKNTFDP